MTPVRRVSAVETYTGLTTCLWRPVLGSRGVSRLIASSSGTNDVFALSGRRYLLM